jgi:cytochrome o ubiquinol oxidase operon protein cyoD
MSSHDVNNSEHGSLKSYVVGYVLSLIFTIIPYYLVVNKVITGTSLWITILGFAFIQMIIQIVFFLHLGRGPKPRWNLYFFVGTVVLVAVVVGGSVFIMNNLHYNMSPTDKIKKLVNDEGIYQVSGSLTGACKEVKTNHKVYIIDGVVVPSVISANKCDSLSFINEDEDLKIITFGIYPERAAYAGEIEIEVESGKSETLTLSDSGTFNYYDQVETKTLGSFTVEP